MPQRAAKQTVAPAPPPSLPRKKRLWGWIACALSVSGFLLFLPRSHQDALPVPPPLDRREAERGIIRTVSSSEDSLAFVEPTDPSLTSVYTPFSGNGDDSSARSKRPNPTARKAAPIRTTLINGQIASKRLPKGNKKRAGTKNSPNTDNFWDAATDKLTQVTAWLKPSASQEASPTRSSTHATSPATELQYPPAHGVARLGLGKAWRNNTQHLLSFGSPVEQCPKQGVQLDAEHCLAPISGADFSNAACELQLSRLNLALYRRPTKRGPLLAHRPPQSGDMLAGQGVTIERHAKSKVLTTPSKGLFWALCPMPPGQTPSPLVNVYGEIAGVVLGASPAYRGHNFFLVGDTSLLYAWLTKGNSGDDTFYDINYALDKRIMQVLKQHPPAPINRGAEINVIARPGKALGKIKLGATRQQIVDFLGEGQRNSCDLLGQPLDNSDAMYSYLTYDTYGIALNFYDDRLVAIETIEAQYHTPFGLGVGIDFEHSKFSHELSRRACRGYSGQGTTLIAIPGLEVELDDKGVIALMRITI